MHLALPLPSRFPLPWTRTRNSSLPVHLLPLACCQPRRSRVASVNPIRRNSLPSSRAASSPCSGLRVSRIACCLGPSSPLAILSPVSVSTHPSAPSGALATAPYRFIQPMRMPTHCTGCLWSGSSTLAICTLVTRPFGSRMSRISARSSRSENSSSLRLVSLDIGHQPVRVGREALLARDRIGPSGQAHHLAVAQSADRQLHAPLGDASPFGDLRRGELFALVIVLEDAPHGDHLVLGHLLLGGLRLASLGLCGLEHSVDPLDLGVERHGALGQLPLLRTELLDVCAKRSCEVSQHVLGLATAVAVRVHLSPPRSLSSHH